MQADKGITEDEMVGWHHPLHGHGFGWTPEVGDGQGGLACSVVSDSLRPHRLQHARLPCPSPSPRICSDTESVSFATGLKLHHLILCRPLLLLSPIPPSIRVFSNESTLGMRWPKYWSFRFSISPSKEIPRLISFILCQPCKDISRF